MGYLAGLGERKIKSRETLFFEGLPARYSPSGKIRIVVISFEENQAGVWDSGEFFYITGMTLTNDLVDTCYVEADSATTAFTKKFELKLIPAILYR